MLSQEQNTFLRILSDQMKEKYPRMPGFAACYVGTENDRVGYSQKSGKKYELRHKAFDRRKGCIGKR